jgi:hypothetical protein
MSDDGKMVEAEDEDCHENEVEGLGSDIEQSKSPTPNDEELIASLPPLPIVNNTMFKIPEEEVEAPVSGNGLSSLTVDVAKLPPLPTPNTDAKRTQATGGATLVIMLAVTFAGVTHGISLTAVDGFVKESAAWWTFLVLIYTEALVGLLCLVGLLATDPGVIQRSPETCFPLPIQVEPWIQAHLEGKTDDLSRPTEFYIASLNTNDNIDTGDTFCVRCLVWRIHKPGTHYFHCNTCQRCVKDFDHHCSVFGRCIAGKLLGRQGNYKYFVGIIVVGLLAYWTAAAALIWSLSLRFDPKWVVPVTLFGLWFVTSTLFNPVASGGFLVCRRVVLAISELVRRCFKK